MSRRGLSLSEILLAACILAACVGPVLYFFPAARRQAGHDEAYLEAWGRARTAVAREAALGRRSGFAARPPREAHGALVRTAEVPGSPGLWRVTAEATGGGEALATFLVVEDHLVADPAVCTSGSRR